MMEFKALGPPHLRAVEEERTFQTESGIILSGKDSMRMCDRRISSFGTSKACWVGSSGDGS